MVSASGKAAAGKAAAGKAPAVELEVDDNVVRV